MHIENQCLEIIPSSDPVAEVTLDPPDSPGPEPCLLLNLSTLLMVSHGKSWPTAAQQTTWADIYPESQGTPVANWLNHITSAPREAAVRNAPREAAESFPYAKWWSGAAKPANIFFTTAQNWHLVRDLPLACKKNSPTPWACTAVKFYKACAGQMATSVYKCRLKSSPCTFWYVLDDLLLTTIPMPVKVISCTNTLPDWSLLDPLAIHWCARPKKRPTGEPPNPALPQMMMYSMPRM